MSESYENLAGASGRARFFRPRRYNALEFFAGAPPRLSFDEIDFDLENISQTGAACISKHRMIETGSDSAKTGMLRLTQRGREILRVPARIARVALAKNGALVGFALEECDFDLSALQRDNARAVSATTIKTARSTAIPSEYKSFCADVLSFVAEYLQHIDQFYAPIEHDFSESETNELVLELAGAAEENWKSLIAEGNRLVIPLHRDKKCRLELKAYTERVVTPVLLEGAGWARSYNKPLGYPGDYRIMNYIYDGTPVGSSIRAKFLHQLSLIGSRPVLLRMKELSRLISNATHNFQGDAFELMSVGCGPARELNEIASAKPPELALRATLIDQDHDALEFAVSAAHQAVTRDHLSINALNISFKEMLNPTSIADLLGNMDVIYSAGLVDYLNPLLAQRFLTRVYQYLKPGGKLIIGNLNDLDSGMIWPCEYVTDWNLYFRSEVDMHAMAREIPGVKTSVYSDASNAIYFLVVEKPISA